jgi:anti-sigma factor RsiW
MNHPKVEELTDFLYGELEPARETEVSAHVHICESCREQVNAWRDVRKDLAAWNVPLTGRLHAMQPATNRMRMTRWAVAAMVLIGTGFGLARLVTPQPDLSAMRAELRNEIRQDLSATLARYADEQASRQQAFQQLVTQVVSRIEARQVAEHANLRKDVETVALHTQEEFERLISFNPSGEVSQPVEH